MPTPKLERPGTARPGSRREGTTAGLALKAPGGKGGAFLRKLRSLIKAPDFAISKNFLTPRKRDAVKRVEASLSLAETPQQTFDAHLGRG